MVAITPRSFCNGTYFRPFRHAFLDMMSLRRLHVFDTRDKAFQDDDVLKENIILHAIKSEWRPVHVTISASSGWIDSTLTVRKVPYDQVVESGDADSFIHIETDEMSRQIGEWMRGLDISLDQLGLRVSTGRVVDFRVRELLRQEADANTAPLIYPAHFSQGYIEWPRANSKKPNALTLTPAADDLLVPRGYYVLVKRLTSEEERRRVVVAIYDPARVPAPRVGFENHLNYFHRQGVGLPMELARGLAAYLNSSLVDHYFRRFNGHTQVNAGDLRKLRFPNEQRLLAIGARVEDRFPNQHELDQIILQELSMLPGGEDANNPIRAKERISEALEILRMLGSPREQLNDRSALTLLALLDLAPQTRWRDAEAPLRGVTEIMKYARDHYGVQYAPRRSISVKSRGKAKFGWRKTQSI